MRPRSRWQHALYPQIGGRDIRHRNIWQKWLPFGAWIYYLAYAWPTRRLAALTLVGILPIGGLFLLGADRPFTVIMLGISTAIPLGILLGSFWRPRVEFSSSYPPLVEAGREFSTGYRVKNTGKRTIVNLSVEALHWPGYGGLLLEGKTLAALPPGTTSEIAGRGRVMHRGRYFLPPLRCDTDFPSGLWCWGRTNWTERILNVYPSYTKLETLELPAVTGGQQDIQSAHRLTRSAIEFYGCREFRHGDLWRHIHARSSARLGIPIVKEFQAEGQGSLALVVDICRAAGWPAPRPGHDPAEAALTLAASMADFLARDQRRLSLLALGPEINLFEEAVGTGYLEEVLTALAEVETTCNDNFQQVRASVQPYLEQFEGLFVVLTRWDAVRAEFINELNLRDIAVRVVLLTRNRKPPALQLSPDIICLDSRRVLRGEVVSL